VGDKGEIPPGKPQSGAEPPPKQPHSIAQYLIAITLDFTHLYYNYFHNCVGNANVSVTGGRGWLGVVDTRLV